MRVAVLAALMACIAFMPGCRYSDTLLNVIFDATGTLEAHADPEYRETEGAPEDPTKASVHLSENENLAQQSNMLPVYKEDAPINGTAVRRAYLEQTVDDYDASEGDEPDEEEDNNTSTSDEDAQDTDSSGEGDGSEQTQVSDKGSDNQADKTSGRGGTGQVYGDGEVENLPDAKAVAAKGQYALITQMLAGKGGLAAADAAWLADMQDKGVFAGEGLDEVAVVWNEDGALDLDALIASDADVIISDGVDVLLTEDERDAITQAGISVVTVPHLGETYTQDKDIVSGVKIIGQILSGLKSDATFATDQMVEKYIELHDTAINGCLNANGGYSYKVIGGTSYQGIYQGTSSQGETTARTSDTRITVSCIDSWTDATQGSVTAKRAFGLDSNSAYRNGLSVDASDGAGLSACTVGNYFILNDYYMQVAGVVNNAYDSPKPVSYAANSERTLPYLVVMGSNNDAVIQPVGNRTIPSALWYSQSGSIFKEGWETVGDASFPCVIVRDDEISQSVARSASKVDGLYNVGQPYDIRQIPEGVAGNWFDGNVESFLTSVWVYGALREGSPDTAKEWTDAFYQTFYRTDDPDSYLEGFDSVRTAACPTG